jgi:hypothetical protein
LNGTIPGGVYAFGPAQSYTETIKTDLEDWKVGLRFTPEFQIAQATTAMLGVSISGGSMRLGTHTDFLYSNLAAPFTINNTVDTKIVSNQLSVRFEPGVRNYLTPMWVVVASGYAGATFKDVSLDAVQAISAPLPNASSTLNASTNRISFVGGLKAGTEFILSKKVALGFMGALDYDNNMPYFIAQSGAYITGPGTAGPAASAGIGFG